MNRKNLMITVSAAAVALAMLSGCAAQAAGVSAQSPAAGTTASVETARPAPEQRASAGTEAAAAAITEEQAKETARKNAGFAESEVQFVWVGLVQNDGASEYKVEFLTVDGAKEYDYHIDAATGEIMSMDREAEKYRANGVQQAQSGAAQSAPTQAPAAPQTGEAAQGRYIGEASAKQIALDHAGIAQADANFVRCFLDFDDGRWEYEVEFYSGAIEYDYAIDAYTGDILSFDYDAEYYTPDQNLGNTAVSGTSITAEQAKQIALDHAGVAERDARRMEMDFDYEWGRAVYEFEWKSGWMEYSVAVDANTGEVVGYEQDWD